MKIPLLLIVLLASINVFASCPVDGDLTSCSIATFQTQLPMQNTYSRKSKFLRAHRFSAGSRQLCSYDAADGIECSTVE